MCVMSNVDLLNKMIDTLRRMVRRGLPAGGVHEKDLASVSALPLIAPCVIGYFSFLGATCILLLSFMFTSLIYLFFYKFCYCCLLFM